MQINENLILQCLNELNKNYISKSDDENILNSIDFNISHWDKEHNINLRKQSEILGESYELNYINEEGEFSTTILNPINCFVLEDGTTERNVILDIHKFSRQFDDKEYMDVYTDSEILHYEIGTAEENNVTNTSTKLNYIGSHNHIFERVPITVCPANSEKKSGFQDIIYLFIYSMLIML